MAEAPERSSDPQQAEAEYQAFVRTNLKRNYAANFLHGMLGMTGFRLFHAPTFIPVYLHQLSGSDAIVGLGLGLQQLGSVASPLFGAAHVEHRQKLMPAAIRIGMGMRLPILLMAIAGWTMGGAPLLWTLILLLFLFGLFNGMQRVVFQLLMARVIPITLRGRLQAWRNLTGGLIAAALSYAAGRYLIEHNAFGNGYSTTFVLAFALTSLGLTTLQLMMREPTPPSLPRQSRVRDRMRDIPRLIGADRDFRNFLVAQGLAMASRIGAPFYALHAAATLDMSGATLGLLTLAFLGADTVSNLIWGYLGDRWGFKAPFTIGLALWVASTVLLIFAQSEAAFVIAFAGLGAGSSAYMISSQTIVLEFGLRDDVAMRVAISSMVEGAITAVGPLIGGLLAGAVGYSWVFWLTVAFECAALAIVWLFVREPRWRDRTVSTSVEAK